MIAVDEVCSQFARALQRSELWSAGHQSHDLPSPGQMLHDATSGAIVGADCDKDRATRAHLGRW